MKNVFCEMEDYEAVLRNEFSAGEGSFAIQLRPDLVWNKEAFSRLVKAMEACAIAHENRDVIERWIAEGFWFMERFVKEWSSHPNFPRMHGDAYYRVAYERLSDLAYWLFFGFSPYVDRGPLDPL